MKISLEWLGDLVDWIETDPAVIAERLTVSSAEVEEIESQGTLLERCCVGKILSVATHPNADKLLLVDVETDDGTKRVVCGGTNLREGMLVAFAHIGATVKWHGGETMTLAPVKIRGEESHGMICAAEELGLEALLPSSPDDGERPIVNLSRLEAAGYKLQAGDDLRTALRCNDTILHVSNKAIPHRPDLFSHKGFARECVALGLARWKKKPATKKRAFPQSPPALRMINDAGDLVPRYAACTLSIEGEGTTPDWMKRRLEATGWRSVSLPVDITNYVLMELGMPLHAFDANDIEGDVHLRGATHGEKITTLDTEERELPAGALVLSDDNGIFDLVGIMGGLRSSTTDATRTVYLHAAVVDPKTIRRTIIATGHRTDAATVYEKGVPPVMAMEGLRRAVDLFCELVPGATITSAIEEWGSDGKAPSIRFTPDNARELLGMPLTEKRITEILEDLGCTTKKSAGKQKAAVRTVQPPLFRLGDLQTERDLIEEVGRIAGFDTIEPQLPIAPVTLHRRDDRIKTIRASLQEAGCLELVPLSLIGPTLLRKTGMDPSHCIALDNPLGEEFSLLAPSLLPRLLEQAQKNIRRRPTLATFAISRIFANGQPERKELALLLSTTDPVTLPTHPALHLEHLLCTATANAGSTLTIRQCTEPPPLAHPGQTADLLLHGTEIGIVCTLHPDVADAFDLPASTAIARMDLSAVLAQSPTQRLAVPVPTVPAIRYDETLTRTQDQPMATLLTTLRGAHPLLESIETVDLFAADPAAASYNLTLRFTYRASDRTLTEEEAKTAHETVLSQLT